MKTNEAKIAERLVAVHAALVEKTGVQPWVEPSMTIESQGVCTIRLYGNSIARPDSHLLGRATGETFDAAFEAAFQIIAEIPDADTEAKRKFHKNLADVIDEGNGLNMPTEVMAPLSEGMTALSENLLTHEPEVAK